MILWKMFCGFVPVRSRIDGVVPELEILMFWIMIGQIVPRCIVVSSQVRCDLSNLSGHVLHSSAVFIRQCPRSASRNGFVSSFRGPSEFIYLHEALDLLVESPRLRGIHRCRVRRTSRVPHFFVKLNCRAEPQRRQLDIPQSHSSSFLLDGSNQRLTGTGPFFPGTYNVDIETVGSNRTQGKPRALLRLDVAQHKHDGAAVLVILLHPLYRVCS